ncbi:Co2+/Mg2+ efflux protein ApaG [Shewanella sp. NKUCC05_KAH]|jgi:ApaG protein|uniref:Protein ApaG n=1 Tax=Shewanella oncorhynchi TaxID=2726434 RepID=A0ABX1KS84_9GAMM|nr:MULTISPECIES: Co2+/Mg2+ efflux protein ApaG [Shewanella]QYX65728.1 Co2+/Mg2+ efflux protein ApaG [Shewanella putrefaciens]GCF90093.1 protein ApaG [Shewanella sp. M-Br]AUD59402.1 Co2+/Mg2+ efflux protein ApaG [Shewanella sp. Pdp11]AVI64857.1 Co2+/Mg2+ efflux protein ApaG [Shewanella sp. WE21]MBI1675183.1 Co2+/Mg2+ efflux protein ApaG [Shewanella sp. DW31]
MSALDTSIRVEVKTEYIEQQSSPEDEKYLFSYTITIINLGEQAAKLETRHWIITDANGNTSEVQGAGVVGETPTIAPNTAYQYTSGTVLDTPLGIMHGTYGMVSESGERFQATIRPFRLATPGLLH